MKFFLMILAAIPLLAFGGLFFLGQKSQNGSPAGLIDGRLSACPDTPNCVSSEAGAQGDQKVDPLPVDIWAALPTAIDALGGSVDSQSANYIAATFTSGFFKFVDDVEFRLAEDAVHVRSASRVGRSDFGVNRERVDALRAKLADG